MLRSIFVIIFVVIYCIISVPILLIETLIRRFNPLAAETSMLKIVQWAFNVIIFLAGTRVTVKGLDNIPKDEAVLFIGNHQSFFDVIISYSEMQTRCGYIAKNNLEKIPLLSWNMRFLYCLFLDRSDLKQGLETILKAIEYIKSGISIFIFPEGTRNRSGSQLELGEFHRGSFKIAQRTDCRIIPVSFNNTAGIFEAHFPSLRPCHVVVEYGAPVRYSELCKEDQRHIDVYFQNVIRDMIKHNMES